MLMMLLLVPLLLSRKKRVRSTALFTTESTFDLLMMLMLSLFLSRKYSCSYSSSYSSFEVWLLHRIGTKKFLHFIRSRSRSLPPFPPPFGACSSRRRDSEAFLCLLRLCLLLGAAAAFGREDILGVTKGALEEEQQPASRRRRRRRIPPRKGEKKTKKKY